MDNKHLKEDGASKKGVDMSIKKGLASNVFAKVNFDRCPDSSNMDEKYYDVASSWCSIFPSL